MGAVKVKKFRGLHAHRYGSDPLERIFAEQWAKENSLPGSGPDVLRMLMTPAERQSGDVVGVRWEECSERDYLVAATVIQWLGSNVGLDFLREVLVKAARKGGHAEQHAQSVYMVLRAVFEKKEKKK